MLKTIDELLEDVFVMDPGVWRNDEGPKGWYAVGTEDEGIIAYFKDINAAYRHRLDIINRILNP